MDIEKQVHQSRQRHIDSSKFDYSTVIDDHDILVEVRRRSNSNNAQMKQANVVLNAITEVICARKKQQGNQRPFPPTPAEYFLTLILHIETNAANQDRVTLGASLYLLTLVFPKVPEGVVKARQTTLAEICTVLLANFSEENQISRHTLTIIGFLLSTVDVSALSNKQVLRCLQSELVFSVDPRPKVRRISQKGVHEVLCRLYQSHGMPKSVCKMIVDFAQREVSQCTNKDCQVALYLCGLLQSIVAVLPANDIHAMIQPLLKLAAQGNSVLTAQVMKTLHSMFTSDIARYAQVPDSALQSRDTSAHHKGHAQLAEQYVRALHELRPHSSDETATPAFLTACIDGFARLQRMQQFAVMEELLPVYIGTFIDYLLSNKKTVVTAAANGVQTLLRNCIHPSMIRFEQNTTNQKTPLETVFVHIQSALNYRFCSVWGYVFHIIQTAFTSLPEPAKSFPIVVPILSSLDSLRDTNQVASFEGDLMNTIGTAIKTFGPHMVLATLPLNLPTSTSKAKQNNLSFDEALCASRGWILPLLRSHTEQAPLALFTDALLPDSVDLHQQAVAALEAKRPVEAKALRQLSQQIWASFTSFCKRPVDVSTAFPKCAKQLGSFLKDDTLPFATAYICRGVSALLETSYHVLHPESVSSKKRVYERDEDAEDDLYDDEKKGEEEKKDKEGKQQAYTNEQAAVNLKAVGQYAKSFLPILFNRILGAPSGERSDLMMVTAWFARAGDPKLVNTLFQKVLQQVLSSEGEAKQGLLDVVLCLIDPLTSSNVSLLFRAAEQLLVDNDAIIQKKAYKIVGEICCSHHNFFLQQWQQIFQMLRTILVQCKAGSQRHRLDCLGQVLLQVPTLLHEENVFKLVGDVLGEIVLSVKDPSLKTRQTAFKILVSFGRRMSDTSLTDVKATVSDLSRNTHNPLLSEFMCMVAGGLALSHPHSKSSAVLGLSSLVYAFQDEIPSVILTSLLSTVLHLLRSDNSHEVAKSVLGFAKVTSLALDEDTLEPHLPLIIQGMCEWANDSKNRFRQKIRTILQILIRKFGADRIKPLIPTSYMKLVTSLIKVTNREDRQKAERWKNKTHLKEKQLAAQARSAGGKKLADLAALLEESDDEDDKDNNNKQSSSRRKGKNQQQLWLSNSKDIDLLDSNAVRHGTSAQGPSFKRDKASDKKKDFKKTRDGRFVIDDDDEDDEDGFFKKKRQNKLMDEEDDLFFLDEKAQKRDAKKKRKRGFGNDDVDDDDDDDDDNEGQQQHRRRHKGGKGRQSTKSRGPDVKNAFIPFTTRMMDKRTKKKTARQFENVIRGAQKGAQKGSKNRNKSRGKRR